MLGAASSGDGGSSDKEDDAGKKKLKKKGKSDSLGTQSSDGEKNVFATFSLCGCFTASEIYYLMVSPFCDLVRSCSYLYSYLWYYVPICLVFGIVAKAAMATPKSFTIL